ncbi:hypothetical protein V2J09_005711 [Rumex salicifolius]
MELILLCGVLVTLLCISLLPYYLTLISSASPRLPPGKTGWPAIGESIEFLSNLQNLDLEKFNFKRMLKYCPEVYKTSVFGDHMAVLCGSAGNKFLFSNDNKLVKVWVIRPIQWIFSSWELAPYFIRYIKPQFLKFVKLDGLKKLVGVMDEMAQQHLQTHWDGVISVYPSAKKFAFELTCRIFMSIEDPHVLESLYDLLETFSIGLNSLPIDLPGTRMRRSLKAGTKLRSELQEIVRQQRASSLQPSYASSPHSNNLVAHLLHVCEDDKGVADGMVALLLGGTDNAASVISNVLKVLAEEPQIYRKVYEENMEIATVGKLLTMEDTQKMKYTWNVAREVMRLYPPTGFFTREAVTDFKYAGFDIPKGYKLISNIHSTHKDPKYFPDPQKFDPSRFEGDGPLPYTYTPFGGGVHLCPGMNYAQQEILVFLHNVVKKFKWQVQIGDEKITGIPFPKPSQGLPIILHPHA